LGSTSYLVKSPSPTIGLGLRPIHLYWQIKTDLSVKDEDLEKCVHQQDPIGLNGGRVEEDRLRRSVEGVGVQDRLDHDEALSQIFAE
jgi:hypothetical protein